MLATHPEATYTATVSHLCRAIRKLSAITLPEEASSPLYRGVRGELCQRPCGASELNSLPSQALRVNRRAAGLLLGAGRARHGLCHRHRVHVHFVQPRHASALHGRGLSLPGPWSRSDVNGVCSRFCSVDRRAPTCCGASALRARRTRASTTAPTSRSSRSLRARRRCSSRRAPCCRRSAAVAEMQPRCSRDASQEIRMGSSSSPRAARASFTPPRL